MVSADASLRVTSCRRQAQILSLEMLNVFLRLKFSPSLNLNPPKYSGGSIFQRSRYILKLFTFRLINK